jgi:hypothetical protein
MPAPPSLGVLQAAAAAAGAGLAAAWGSCWGRSSWRRCCPSCIDTRCGVQGAGGRQEGRRRGKPCATAVDRLTTAVLKTLTPPPPAPLQFDPNARVQDAMTAIWLALVDDPRKTGGRSGCVKLSLPRFALCHTTLPTWGAATGMGLDPLPPLPPHPPARPLQWTSTLTPSCASC